MEAPPSTYHANIARLQEIFKNLRRFRRFSENPAFKNENDVLLQRRFAAGDLHS
jgi:hypothetical protein